MHIQNRNNILIILKDKDSTGHYKWSFGRIRRAISFAFFICTILIFGWKSLSMKAAAGGVNVDIEILKEIMSALIWIIGALLSFVFVHKGTELGKHIWAKKENVNNDLENEKAIAPPDAEEESS